MKHFYLYIVFVVFFSSAAQSVVHAAEPTDNGNDSLLPVQVNVTLSPTGIPAPTTVPSPTTTQKPETTPVPTVRPTSAPVPTKTPPAVPTSVPSPTPVPEVLRDDEIKISIGSIMSKLGDIPTPTPTPQEVQVMKSIVTNDPQEEEKEKTEQTQSPVVQLQRFMGPSASFFVHVIPGNYYLINSLTKSQSAGLLVVSLLLMSSGAILLYKTQQSEIARIMESFTTKYLLPFWTRKKENIFTIFDRDYAK